MNLTGLFARLGPFAPLAVFGLAAAESAAFVGLVIPGELAVILGGVAAGAASASLPVMIGAAVSGAIVGDSIGYRLGKQMGDSLESHPRLAKVASRLDGATRLIARRGWWALVLARFASVLRAVVPFAAGMGRMPYGRFLLGNAIGGILWGTTFTLVGYWLGGSYQVVEKWMRTGGLAIVALGALVAGIVWLTRWAARHDEAVRNRLVRVAGHRPISYLVSGARRTNRPALTLVLTAAGIVAAVWLFGGLFQDVVGTEEFFFFDLSSLRYLNDNQIPVLAEAAKIINWFTSITVMGVLAGLAMVVLVRRRRAVAAAIGLAVGGQWAVVEIIDSLVQRTPPAFASLASRVDYGFPSEHVALVATLVCLAAWPWTRPTWTRTVRSFGAAGVIVALTGAARVVLLVEYPSDVIAAAAVAVAWTLLVCIVFDPNRSSQLDPLPSPGPAASG